MAYVYKRIITVYEDLEDDEIKANLTYNSLTGDYLLDAQKLLESELERYTAVQYAINMAKGTQVRFDEAKTDCIIINNYKFYKKIENDSPEKVSIWPDTLSYLALNGSDDFDYNMGTFMYKEWNEPERGEHDFGKSPISIAPDSCEILIPYTVQYEKAEIDDCLVKWIPKDPDTISNNTRLASAGSIDTLIGEEGSTKLLSVSLPYFNAPEGESLPFILEPEALVFTPIETKLGYLLSLQSEDDFDDDEY